MTKHIASQPIGIFDSGIGGLTITKEVTALLPNENIIYFGDTAHAPWGDKSTTAINIYTTKICELLLSLNCKAILIACNTASSVSAETVKNIVKDKTPVINVIDPIAELISKNYSNQKVGLIGTKQTVNSKSYQNKINKLNPTIKIIEKATPLLAPLIEEGFFEDKNLTNLILDKYLNIEDFKDIKALILGCTHYPLIKNEVKQYFNNKIDVLDALTIANNLKDILKQNNLLNQSATNAPNRSFYISDYNDFFEKTAKIFFEGNYHLEKFPLWD